MAPSYRPDIDGLRALSIAAVVAYHAAPDALPGGFVGVDVFFVISGYLITQIITRELTQGRFSLASFYARRIRRILPALVLVLAACLAVGWFVLFPIEYRSLGKHTGAAAGFFSNIALWAESGYFDAASETKPLLHLWSLAVEEQYYLLWPLVLTLAFRSRVPARWLAWAGFAASLVACIVLTRTNPVAAFFLPGTRFWEILAGALLVLQGENRSGQPAEDLQAGQALRDAASVAGVVGIAASAVLLDGNAGSFPGWQAMVPVGSAALLIAAGPGGFVNRTVLSHRFVVALGLVSFPLYLWHWPLLSYARIIEGNTPALDVRILAVATALLLAVATTLLVERPVRRRPVRLGQSLVLLAALGTVGVAGAAVYLDGGVPGRSALAAFARNETELVRLPERDPACLTRIADPRPVFPYCRLTPAGPRTVAVIGDSHAHVAYPGIAEVLARRGVGTILLANSGCPPFLGAEYGIGASGRETCRRGTEAIVDLVARDATIGDVLVFSRGPLYVTGDGFGEAERTRRGPPLIEPERFYAGLQATVDRLAGAGKRVVYVLENPETGLDPRRCIDRPFRAARPCAVDEATVLQRQADYRRRVATLRGVVVADPLEAFCAGGTCRLLGADGALLYADDNHLSVAGSRRQAETTLADILAGVPAGP